jgi:hypothetical protein
MTTSLVERSALEVHLTEKDTVFFLHIPKTGGTTLGHVLFDHFDRRRIAPFIVAQHPQNWITNSDISFIRAHMPYGMMCQLLGTDPITITMLRDPVERFLSQFAHRQRNAARNSQRLLHQEARRNKLRAVAAGRVRQAIEDPQRIWDFVDPNSQSFFLGTDIDLEEVRSRRSRWKDLRRERARPEDLDVARTRLGQLGWIGLTDRYQDSLFLLGYTFGWRPEPNRRHFNAGANRQYRDDVGDTVVERIRQIEAPDIALYADAERIFAARYEQMVEELLLRHGTARHAELPRPLSDDVIFDLLMLDYDRRFAEANPARARVRVDFDAPLWGSGWHQREGWPEGSVRWSGPETVSTLDVAVLPANNLRVQWRVLSAAAPDLLHSPRLSVNGAPVGVFQRFVRGKGALLEAWIPRALLGQAPARTSLELTLDRTVTPIVPDPTGGGQDPRQLGVAVHWVEVAPASRRLPFYPVIETAIMSRLVPFVIELRIARRRALQGMVDLQSRLRVGLAVRTRLRQFMSRFRRAG